MNLPLGQKELPSPPKFRKLIGPSFIVLGLGLGSGEIILWPYLTSNHGLGIIWAIVIGITMQFFINLEVERYALIHGESVFVGFARWLKFLPFWFIVSTFLGFGWPGIGLAGATLLSNIIPQSTPNLIGIIVFIFIGLLLSLGKVLYQTVENLQKFLITIGTPAILILTFYLAKPTDFSQLFSGLIGIGDGYNFLPAGISLATFLSALVYSGAGGNLNLTQGNYIRDKGYGMGIYADKIKNLLSISQESQLTGNTFPLNSSNLNRFHKWWRLINLEHFLVFWVLGALTMISLAFLSFITTYHQAGNVEGINFVINQANFISQSTLPLIGTAFLLITGLMLTATQLTVLDSTSRIISENILLTRGKSAKHLTKTYYLTLWTQIIFGIVIMLIGFKQPRDLITLSAVINSFTMFVYILLLVKLNNKLPHALRPHPLRSILLVISSLLFGTLFALTIKSIF